MKKFLLSIMTVVFSVISFSEFNNGKYEVLYQKDDYTLSVKMIVNKSKIIFIDFDRIDKSGIRLSTINNEFRNNKELIKKHILDKQSFDKIPAFSDKNSKDDFNKLFEYLIEKNKENKSGNFTFN